MSRPAIQRLRELRGLCRSELDNLPACGWVRPAHPDLSPLAWHLGHCFFVEAYWLQEVVHGDPQQTGSWHALYFPENAAKTGRARRLPDPQALLAWTHEIEATNEVYWAGSGQTKHQLLSHDYLPWFLAQHYAQHIETMRLAHQQRALAEPRLPRPASLLPENPPSEAIQIPARKARLGANGEAAPYDNELPELELNIPAFRLARHPVSNNQWLGFIRAGGYAEAQWWDADGRAWLEATGARHPQHWRQHPQGGYYCPNAAEPLTGTAPVHGLCWHEARAYARWAGARLPHEHEWEHAARLGLMENDGQVWEWCANTLRPYPGFRAFPYAGYSTPWFDGGHAVLRGTSRHSTDDIRRPSFRNFYPASHRHVCAGLRLAFGSAPELVDEAA